MTWVLYPPGTAIHASWIFPLHPCCPLFLFYQSFYGSQTCFPQLCISVLTQGLKQDCSLPLLFPLLWGCSVQSRKSQGSTPIAVTCSQCKLQLSISYWLAAVRNWSEPLAAGLLAGLGNTSQKMAGEEQDIITKGEPAPAQGLPNQQATRLCLQDTCLDVSTQKCGLDLGLALCLQPAAGDPGSKKPMGLPRWWAPLSLLS